MCIFLMPVCILTYNVALSAAIGDEPGPGGFVVSGDALRSLQAHGFLSVYSLGVCHHRV